MNIHTCIYTCIWTGGKCLCTDQSYSISNHSGACTLRSGVYSYSRSGKVNTGCTELPPPEKEPIFLQPGESFGLLLSLSIPSSHVLCRSTQSQTGLRADRISLEPRKQGGAVAAGTWRPKGKQEGHVPMSFHAETSPLTNSDSRAAQARWGPSTLEPAGGYAEAGGIIYWARH